MNSFLPIIYLTIVTSILIVLIVFLFRQILQKKEIEQTLSNLQSKIRANNADNLDYYSLGIIYLSKKLFDQAILQFRCALKNWDQNDKEGLANVYNTIGFTYSETNQYDLAIYYYTESLKCLPNYITALNNLAYAYEKKQMPEKAIETYKQVLLYDNKNTIAQEKLEIISRRVINRDDRI